MSIERLSPEDEMMLWPDKLWPQDIGAVAVLDGAMLLDAGGRFRIDLARSWVAGRLHLVPRFRQVLHVPPRSLGGPLWIDAGAFDIVDHVHFRQVPPPADEAALLAAVEQVRRLPLDRARPLWEMWFLTGLPDRRVALFVRLHHCIADGMAAVATMAAFLVPGPDVAPDAPQPWTPAAPPTDAELLADERRARAERRRRLLTRMARPVDSARRLRAAWPALRELVADRPLPPTSIHRVVGPRRTFALVRGRLDVFKAIAHGQGATVNDVLLTATAGGLRRLLAGRGEDVDRAALRIYVPVSLHDRSGQARGNLISQMVVSLPIDVADPGTRLRAIATETARGKGRPRPSLGKLPRRAGLLGGIFLKLVSRQRVNVVSADIPGPPVPLFFAGARLLEVFPMVQLIGTVSLGVGAMSYAGQLNVMAVADGDAFPDLDVFAAGLGTELAALAEAGSARSIPAPAVANASKPASTGPVSPSGRAAGARP